MVHIKSLDNFSTKMALSFHFIKALPQLLCNHARHGEGVFCGVCRSSKYFKIKLHCNEW